MADYIKDNIARPVPWKRGVQSPFPGSRLEKMISKKMHDPRYEIGDSFWVTMTADLCKEFGYPHTEKGMDNLRRGIFNYFRGRDGQYGWIRENGLRWEIERDARDKDGNLVIKFTRHAGVTLVNTEAGLKIEA